MNIKFIKVILLLLFVFVLSGCDITYNLDISSDGLKESVDIIYGVNEKSMEYAIPVIYGELDYEDPEVDFLEKDEAIKYYNSTVSKNDDSTIINYSYKFKDNSIKNSNFINSSYKTFIFKKYDHDEDGKKDYMILATGDDFDIFERFDMIDNIKVNITCYYKVISSNADQVNENVYTWYLTKDDIKSINMVYNPGKIVDYRSFLEKLFDGNYGSLVLMLVFGGVLIVAGIIYLIMKKRSEKVDKI